MYIVSNFIVVKYYSIKYFTKYFKILSGSKGYNNFIYVT